jgi:hypothetical protein
MMICTHDEKGRTEASARIGRIRTYYASSKYPVRDDLDLVDRMLQRLTSAFEQIEITGDQWHGVTYRWHRYIDDERVEQEPIYIECDHPIDGVAYIFEKVVMEKPVHGGKDVRVQDPSTRRDVPGAAQEDVRGAAPDIEAR